jgi:hypothetical protein
VRAAHVQLQPLVVLVVVSHEGVVQHGTEEARRDGSDIGGKCHTRALPCLQLAPRQQRQQQQRRQQVAPDVARLVVPAEHAAAAVGVGVSCSVPAAYVAVEPQRGRSFRKAVQLLLARSSLKASSVKAAAHIWSSCNATSGGQVRG